MTAKPYAAKLADIHRTEAQRIADVKALGSVPEPCGPDIPEAPARGAVRMFTPYALYPDTSKSEGYAIKEAGYRGRKGLQIADQFDQVRVNAKRHRQAAPFTRRQEHIGRAYRDLAHDLDNRGMSRSSLNGSRGGGDGRDFMDALLADRQVLDRMQRRIGTGVALAVRRVRPSQRGTKSGITDRELVDRFCLREQTLSEILKAHGWAVKGSNITALKKALGAALDRMAGPMRGKMQRAGDSLSLDAFADEGEWISYGEFVTDKKGVDT